MTEFEYLLIDKEGKQVRSIMKADSEAAVALALRNGGGIPIKITPFKKAAAGGGLFKRRSISNKDLIVFTRQLGAVLTAGVLLSEAIETISDDMENEYFSGVLKSVLRYVHGGESFSRALSRFPKVFSSYYVAIVASGESIGNLGSTVTNLAGFMEESERMRLKFVAAVRYPIFLMCFVFCIVSAIVLFLIPKFKVIFEGAGSKLPPLTQIVVAISEFCLHNFVFVIVGIAALIIGATVALRDFRVRFLVDYELLQMPVVGTILRKAFFAQFCHTLSMLIKGGVSIIASLNLTTKVMGNYYLRHRVTEIRQAIMTGSSLSAAMTAYADFPRILVKMVAVGEKAGKLDDMLKKIAAYYDQEVEEFLNNINTFLEPILIIVIGSIVLVVALALYLPIFQMSSAVH